MKAEQAGIYFDAKAAHWLVARPGTGGSFEFVAAGQAPKAGAAEVIERGDWPAPLAELVQRSRPRLSIGVDIPLRSGLVELPPLSPEELEQALPRQAARELVLPGGADRWQFVSERQEDVWDVLTTVCHAKTIVERSATPSLLAAFESERAAPWMRWSATARPRPRRLEPAFTALCRAVRGCIAAQHGDRAILCCYDDGTFAASIIVRGGTTEGVRYLPYRESDVAVWTGDSGLRRLREVLFAWEDRYPDATLDGVMAYGIVAPEWLERAASTIDVDALPTLTPPTGLTAADLSWPVPLGLILGACA